MPVSASAIAWERHLGHEVHPERLRSDLVAGSLPAAFAQTARQRGSALALEIDGRAAAHDTLDRQGAVLAGWLRGQGVARGDRVLIAGANSLELVRAYLGTLRADATAVFVDPALAGPEIRHIVDDVRPVVAFACEGVRAQLPEPALGSRSPLAVVGLTEHELAALVGSPLEVSPVTAPALIAYTSGTSGRPKGVVLSHANVLASVRAAMWSWRWSKDDVLAHALPLSHQHGLSGVNMTLLAGSRAVLHSRFDPQSLCTSIERSRATVMFAVPAMYERLTAWEGLGSADLSSLRLAVSGSAPLDVALAERARSALGELPLERYGSTEGGLNLSNLYAGPRRPGYVGYPLPGVQIRIVDDRGRELGEDEPGELLVRGPQVFEGYWQADEGRRGRDRRGWFHTGDLARIDPASGEVAIVGRTKELIITGGLNVHPREVELVLNDHPAVARAAVAGVPSERWGEEVVAFVVPAAAELDDADLAAHCRTRLAAYKCPKRFVAVRELPLNRMGKLERGRLPELAAQGSASNTTQSRRSC